MGADLPASLSPSFLPPPPFLPTFCPPPSPALSCHIANAVTPAPASAPAPATDPFLDSAPIPDQAFEPSNIHWSSMTPCPNGDSPNLHISESILHSVCV